MDSTYMFGISDLATMCVKLIAIVAPIPQLLGVLVIKIPKFQILGRAPQAPAHPNEVEWLQCHDDYYTTSRDAITNIMLTMMEKTQENSWGVNTRIYNNYHPLKTHIDSANKEAYEPSLTNESCLGKKKD